MERVINVVTSMTLTSALIGAAVGIVAYWVIQKLRYRKPPGPFALPLIGNYSLMNDKFLYKTCLKMVKNYGPIIRVYMGPFETIILNDIESVTEALIQRGADFADRPMTNTLDALTEGRKDITFSPYNANWKLQRKIVIKALREYLKDDKLQTAIHASFSSVSKLFSEQTEPFDPAEYMDFTVFNVLSHFCYKEHHTFDDPEFRRMMEIGNELLDTFGLGTIEDIFPFFKNIYPSRKYKKLTSLFQEIFRLFNKKLHQHEKTFERDNIRDFVDSLLLARQDAEQEDDEEVSQQLTETHIRQTLVNIMFAGIGTSRFTLTWAMLFMAGYPDIQAKCQKEIDSVIGLYVRSTAKVIYGREKLRKKEKPENGRPLELEDKHRLPYTDACLMEIMRLGMALPLGIPHSALCDSQIGGYDIPKGTVLLINHYALHMDPRHWENPSRFDPNRYLDDNGKVKQKPDSWLPFSAGRRVCLGETVSKLELFTIFASFLHQFKISLPEGVVANFEIKGEAARPLPEPFKIIVKKRD